MERVVVIGASNNPERYSNKAMKMLAEYGHETLPVAPAVAEIEGRPAVATPADVKGPVDTVTMYVGPARQGELLDAIVALKPKRVIFNPGTENPDAYTRLDAAGIPHLEACTLVLLRTRQF
ncbi:CoA-binding protein [Uliginosibacterium sp. 31-16]|uniref:CoA-binding protein n=1 Tax=Uliginosibacterium sp. 31-16 TaxID=3068315 RepID=UPI00273D83AC|nr:CoA-binding protein [Uliginosibacterium sp. 31-16]MDP5239304.1 CoA-binding protein [Uliginosibacterium sp. 31-16]